MLQPMAAGATSPADPSTSFADKDALSRTPYIYLVPCGVDSMRSPPLGDRSTVRTWSVEDQAIPLPFNIGNTDFSTSNSWQASDSLSEPAFTIRKHQAFRAVPGGTNFSDDPGFTNARLIGRSVWNSRWKIVIPGQTLLNDPNKGMETFLKTVRDIQLTSKLTPTPVTNESTQTTLTYRRLANSGRVRARFSASPFPHLLRHSARRTRASRSTRAPPR